MQSYTIKMTYKDNKNLFWHNTSFGAWHTDTIHCFCNLSFSVSASCHAASCSHEHAV